MAVATATAYLSKRDPTGALALVLRHEATIERPFGWVFFYNSKQFVDSGDVQHALFGNAPLIVSRADGSIHVTGTGEPIEHYIQEYERAHPPSGDGAAPR